jgi:hypothetical protein
MPYSNMALMPTERMGPPPGALPPMRMTASWSGSERTYRIQVRGAKSAAMASSPRISTDTQAPSQTPKLCKKPLSRFIIAPRAQASKPAPAKAGGAAKHKRR